MARPFQQVNLEKNQERLNLDLTLENSGLHLFLSLSKACLLKLLAICHVVVVVVVVVAAISLNGCLITK